MLNRVQAQKLFQNSFPAFPIQAWARYGDLYLFRVKFPYPGEENFDPFFSVDVLTSEIRDFSVITDGDLSELVKLEWNNVV